MNCAYVQVQSISRYSQRTPIWRKLIPNELFFIEFRIERKYSFIIQREYFLNF